MFKKKILPTIMFFILLLGMAVFPYIPISLFKINFNEFSFVMKMVYNFVCNLGFMFILFLLYKDKIIKDFKNYFKKFASNFELSFKYYFIGVIVMIASNLIIALFFSGATAGNEEAVREMIDQVPLYMIFSVSIYAPFVEELIFRHSIKDSIMCFGNNNILKYFYIFTSGFIFGLMHILGQTSSFVDYLYLIPYSSLGIAFAALYSKTDNICSSIMMHMLHNTVTIMLYFSVGGVI